MAIMSDFSTITFSTIFCLELNIFSTILLYELDLRTSTLLIILKLTWLDYVIGNFDG